MKNESSLCSRLYKFLTEEYGGHIVEVKLVELQYPQNDDNYYVSITIDTYVDANLIQSLKDLFDVDNVNVGCKPDKKIFVSFNCEKLPVEDIKFDWQPFNEKNRNVVMNSECDKMAQQIVDVFEYCADHVDCISDSDTMVIGIKDVDDKLIRLYDCRILRTVEVKL